MLQESQPGAAAFSDKPWFLIHSQPCRERSVISKLGGFGIKTFLPLTFQRRANGFHCPLFPSYIFASFEYAMHRDVNESLSRLPLLGRVVYFGSRPAEVPVEILVALAERLDAAGCLITDDRTDVSAPVARFDAGDRVLISDGPLKGMMGIFQGTVKGREAAYVLLTTIEHHSQGISCGRQLQDLKGSSWRVEVDARNLVLA
ncbi:MAG TPA: transcription termination/antitermination NusG family protein [Candidatus Angelobacter sp.]|nr:transcription termination/antitermination NusG family protein [Candidatus Angelobacter sp.]